VFVGEKGVEGEERESRKEGDDVEFVVLYDSSVCLGVCLPFKMVCEFWIVFM